MKKSCVKILDQGDVLEFEIKPSAPSVFLLSQKFHRDWEALAETDHGWKAAQTVEVNGVFQGVLVAQDTCSGLILLDTSIGALLT